MADGFRVQTLTIEGFKGFTTPKVIDLKGRHAFLLGQNGNGKSSIVEAIRWGLFGSTGRPNEIVANRGYATRCRVEVTLIRDGRRWNLRRTLIRGVSGGSDAELTDEHGQEHPIREILPQLDSLDAGEGTHIIFAPQSVPLRRQPEDLTPFERTVFNHLGLTHPRALLSGVKAFVEEQALIEHKLGARLTDCRDQIDRRADDFGKQRGRLLASRPWPSEHPPTVVNSENRARKLIEEITGEPAEQSLDGASLDGLIDAATEALQDRRDRDRRGLESELSRIEERLALLGDLNRIREDVEAKRSEADQVQTALSDILGEMSIDGLRKNVSTERAMVDTDALRLQVAENASSLLRREEAESVFCPVCTTEHVRPDLESKLQRTISQLSGDRYSSLRKLEARYKDAVELQLKIEGLHKQLAELEDRASHKMTSIGVASHQASTSAQLKTSIDSLEQRKSSITTQMESIQGWIDDAKMRLSKLNDEGRFHQIQRNLLRSQESKNRFMRVEKAYDDLVSFNESVNAIGKAVESCLAEQLEKKTPEVSDDLSQVFAALTRHPWYDRLIIDNSKLPGLELLVASSHDPLNLGHPTGVLNGQAESALELVPHFAFGQADGAPTEVYLVLLDDPTRAFDEEHIDILIQRLAELGRSVQLIVASQETSRFRALLPTNFEPASFVVVEPQEWSYHDGPELDIDYGDQ